MDSQFFGVLQFWPDKQVQKFLKTGVSKMIQACNHHVGTSSNIWILKSIGRLGKEPLEVSSAVICSKHGQLKT